jgi:hypothetical protein
MTQPAAFYCVTGRDFFPGVVALLNSLRLVGHTEPLHVLDCGMDPHQRARLAKHATVVPATSADPPSMQKLVLPELHPAEVRVLCDADLIVTRPLDELLETAAARGVVAFENDTPRHFPEWGELLGLGRIRPAPYVSSGAVFAGGDAGVEALRLLGERQGSVDPERTWLGSATEREPFYYLDQDVLNAVLHSRIPPEELTILDARMAPIPPFAGVRLRDAASLRCEYRDGTAPYLLHHCFRKPWLVPVRSNPYSRLLTRLLLGPDVPLRLDPGELPRRLRGGAVGRSARLASDLYLAGPGIARRLRRRPVRVTPWPNSSAP